jgi:hypothetical protein
MKANSLPTLSPPIGRPFRCLTTSGLDVDSLTEMAIGTALAYCQAINLPPGYSYPSITAREICTKAGMLPGARRPYWMRRGYVEEVFTAQR